MLNLYEDQDKCQQWTEAFTSLSSSSLSFFLSFVQAMEEGQGLPPGYIAQPVLGRLAGSPLIVSSILGTHHRSKVDKAHTLS